MGQKEKAGCAEVIISGFVKAKDSDETYKDWTVVFFTKVIISGFLPF